MRATIQYFLKNPIAGNLLMVFLFLAGIYGMLQMKTTFFPETPSRTIFVQVVFPGSSPEEVEEGIVSRIEENLKGVTGVDRVSSVSNENAGNITIEVLKGYDADVVLQDVRNAVDRIPSFPANMEPLIVFKRESLGQAISLSLNGDVDLRTLKAFARKVEKDLLKLDGLSKVELSGFPEEEIEISFREVDLRAFNLTFDQAVAAVRGTNIEITGGSVKSDKEELLIRAKNRSYVAQNFNDIVIQSNPNGGVVRLSQVADITDQWEDSPERTYLNGVPSVILKVQNTLQEDMVGITEMVKDYVHTFNRKNDIVKATVISDSSISLNQRIELLRNNGLIGFGIVLVLLAMFLHWRLAFWVALAIPISFAGMFLVCSAIGVTINVISLFGMILVIGILVDDGIVIAENIYQKYESGMPAMEAATEGTMQVLPAVFSAIITTVIAFCAFFFIDGRLGDIFLEMAIVVIFSLVFSLVEGALILPAHVAHSKALKQKGKQNILARYLDRFMGWMRDYIYEPALQFAINFSFPMLAICIAMMFIVMGSISGGFIKTTFFPVIPRDNFSINLKLPSGARENLTEEILDSIQTVIYAVNEDIKENTFNGKMDPIVEVQKNIGPASNVGNIQVEMADGESRGDISARMLIAEVREKLGTIYEAESLTFSSGSPFGMPVSISLLGNDYKELDAAVDAVKAELGRLSDLKDVYDNNQEGLKEINISLKPQAYNLGYTLQSVLGQVRQGFFGAEIQRLQRGVDEVRVWVRYKLEDRNDITKLESMRIRSATGQSVPLGELATFTVERGVVGINHLDGQREIKIEADVANDKVSISDVTNDIKTLIVPSVLKNYPSVSASYEGQNREQEKTQKSMQLIMPAIAICMLFVVILTFKSVSQAFIVFLLIPFGFIGVGLGHYVVDLPISLFSILGVIALIGVLVNDALVFITTFNDNIRQGTPFRESIEITGRSRFRPILLTTATTVAGLAPLILEKSFQAQFLIPMAVSVAFGLLIVTVVILLLVPALLVISNRIKLFSLNLWEGKRLAPEMVEPAYEGRQTMYPLVILSAIAVLIMLVILIMLTMKITAGFI